MRSLECLPRPDQDAEHTCQRHAIHFDEARAFTERLDDWFAASGTVLMQPAVNAPFFFETRFEGKRHPHYGRFLRLDPERVAQLTWVNAATKGAETVVAVDLASAAKLTLLRLTHAGFPDEESKRRHEQAWPRVLSELDERMAR